MVTQLVVPSSRLQIRNIQALSIYLSITIYISQLISKQVCWLMLVSPKRTVKTDFDLKETGFDRKKSKSCWRLRIFQSWKKKQKTDKCAISWQLTKPNLLSMIRMQIHNPKPFPIKNCCCVDISAELAVLRFTVNCFQYSLYLIWFKNKKGVGGNKHLKDCCPC